MWLTANSSGARASRTTTLRSASAARRSAVLISDAASLSPSVPSRTLGAADDVSGLRSRTNTKSWLRIMRPSLNEGSMQRSAERRLNGIGRRKPKEDLRDIAAIADGSVAPVGARDGAYEGKPETEARSASPGSAHEGLENQLAVGCRNGRPVIPQAEGDVAAALLDCGGHRALAVRHRIVDEIGDGARQQPLVAPDERFVGQLDYNRSIRVRASQGGELVANQIGKVHDLRAITIEADLGTCE